MFARRNDIRGVCIGFASVVRVGVVLISETSESVVCLQLVLCEGRVVIVLLWQLLPRMRPGHERKRCAHGGEGRHGAHERN